MRERFQRTIIKIEKSTNINCFTKKVAMQKIAKEVEVTTSRAKKVK
jgi:hypothetical protein